MHTHNPYHANESYVFDISKHMDEALSRPLLVRNRALYAIDAAVHSNNPSFSAFIKEEDVAGVRLATQHARHKMHHVGAVMVDGKHYLKVVRRRHA